ncbi:MAG: HAMP domain-containing sensor histidine kinase, partial [bacterium]|nr:HAMP domain-containing sensor histidine kinase [bacterium]
MSGLSTRENGSANKEAEDRNVHPIAPLKETSGDAPEVTTILSHLAHDLRSPLNTIIGFSDVLHSGRMGKLNSSQKKQLGIILDRGTELLDLVDDLVEYSRVLSHRTEVCVTTISLNSLLKHSVERLRTALSQEDVQLTYRACDTPLRIKGEERKLARLFQSIVSDGATLFHPREIGITVEDHAGETGAGAV